MRNTFLWLSVECETPDIQLEVTSNRGQILVLAYRYHKAQKYEKKNLPQSKNLTKNQNEIENIKKFSPTSLPALILKNTMSDTSSKYEPMQ